MVNTIKRSWYAVPILIFILSVGVLSFNLTPCRIISGQINCVSSTNNINTNPLSIYDAELNVGSTPNPGFQDYILYSNGPNNSPEWRLGGGYRQVPITTNQNRTSTTTYSLLASTLSSVNGGQFSNGEIVEIAGYLSFTSNSRFGICRTGECSGVMWVHGDDTNFIMTGDQNTHFDMTNAGTARFRAIFEMNSTSTTGLYFTQTTASGTSTVYDPGIILYRQVNGQ